MVLHQCCGNVAYAAPLTVRMHLFMFVRAVSAGRSRPADGIQIAVFESSQASDAFLFVYERMPAISQCADNRHNKR